ncbi:MAG: hypothetical protein QXX95_07285 [Nitrososphaerales archaeon]
MKKKSIFLVSLLFLSLLSYLSPAYASNLKLEITASPKFIPADNNLYPIIVLQLFKGKKSIGAPKDIDVFLKVSDEILGEVQPEAKIKKGSYFTIVNFKSSNIPGKVKVIAQAEDFEPVETEIITVKPRGIPHRIELEVFPSVVRADPDMEALVMVYLVDYFGKPTKAERDILVVLESSNEDVIKVDREIIIGKGNWYQILKAEPNYKQGKAIITAKTKEFGEAKAEISTIGRKPIALSLHIFPKTLPADGNTMTEFAVQLLDANGLPTRTSEDVKVRLTLSNSSIGIITQEVTIPAGSSQAFGIFKVTKTAGNAIISAVAFDLRPAFEEISTFQPTKANPVGFKIQAIPSPSMPNPDEPSKIIISLIDSQGLPAYTKRNTEVFLSLTNTTLGRISSDVITISANGILGVVEFIPSYSTGKTTLIVSASGLTPDQFTLSIVGFKVSKIQIHKPRILLADSSKHNLFYLSFLDANGFPVRLEKDISFNISSNNTRVIDSEGSNLISKGSYYKIITLKTSDNFGKVEVSVKVDGLQAKENFIVVEIPPSRISLYLNPNKFVAKKFSFNNLLIQVQDSEGIPSIANEDIEIDLSLLNSSLAKVEKKVTLTKGSNLARATLEFSGLEGKGSIIAFSSKFPKTSVDFDLFKNLMKLNMTLVKKEFLYREEVNVTLNAFDEYGASLSDVALNWEVINATIVKASNLTSIDGKAELKLRTDKLGKALVRVEALKEGYKKASLQEIISVKSRKMKIDAEAKPSTVVIGKEILITVKAHTDSIPLEGVLVKIETSFPNLSPLEGSTNKDGNFESRLRVDKEGLAEIKISASKEGFSAANTSIKVEGITLGQKTQETIAAPSPFEFGFSFDLLLMILLAIIVPFGALVVFRKKRKVPLKPKAKI